METQIHTRIDNRLLHGQVVQFWIPHLEIACLIVADDHVSANESLLAIYRMAVPKAVQIKVVPVLELKAELVYPPSPLGATMILLNTIHDAKRAIASGADLRRLTLGNVHTAANRRRITDSVYLSEEELGILADLQRQGIVIEIQTFPNEILYLKTNAQGESRWSKH